MAVAAGNAQRGPRIVFHYPKRPGSRPDTITGEIFGKVVQPSPGSQLQPEIPILESGQRLVVTTRFERGCPTIDGRGMRNRVGDQRTPFEAALLLADLLREVLPAQWKIKYDGNTFTIEKDK